MSNLPVEIKDKLNIWQKFRITIFLMRKHNFDDYQNAPEYIKNDEKVQNKILGEGKLSKTDMKHCIPIFKKNCNIFNEDTRREIVELAIKEYPDYSIVSYLSSEEQYKFIMKNKDDVFLLNSILKYIDTGVAERLIEERFDKLYSKVFSVPYEFIKDLNENVQLALLEKNKELIEYTDVNVQVQYIKEHEEYIDLVDNKAKRIFLENNIEFLNQHIEYIKNASKTTQLLFASQKKENVKYINEEYQIELIEKHPSAFEYASSNVKQLLFNHSKYKEKYCSEPFEIINKLLNHNLKYFKYVGYVPGIADHTLVTEYLKNLEENIPNMEINDIIDIFTHSGILSAKGNLRMTPSSYYTGLDEGSYSSGLDIYNDQQIDVIQKLNIQQISQLVKIDANYIMPYIIQGNSRRNGEEILEEKNLQECKDRCKKVFIELYGQEKFQEIEDCIDTIFDAQIVYEQKGKGTDLDRKPSYKFEKPLESLKLLFNEKIITSNPSQLIKKYYSELFKSTEGKEDFIQLIQNTYGEKAIEILNSRKELDVYAINSLEIFDERILNNFSEEFINDMISYNIRDFSTFLNIVKNAEDLELFKTYYNTLSEVLGENVVTMQKAISEFYYNKDLLKNIETQQLTDKEQINLLSILCGEKNKFDISTIEQIDNYNEIVNNDLKERIETGQDTKELIFSHIFGISQADAEEIESLFGLETVKDIMTKEEIEIVECIKFILHENEKNRLKDLLEDLMQQTNLKNPIAIYSAISKVKEHSFQIFQDRLLTKDKLDQICIDKQDSGEIRKENIDGIEIYYFEGLKIEEMGLGFIAQDTSNSNGRDFMEYEGQAGMSTVSGRLYMDSAHLLSGTGNETCSPDLIFSEIQSEDLLAYRGADAGILHAPKLVKSKAITNRGQSKKITSKEVVDGGNEFAFYRRTRNHQKREKENLDGRIKPSFVLVFNNNNKDGSISDIPKEKLEYAKKHNIPIIVYKRQKYMEQKNIESENKYIDNER